MKIDFPEKGVSTQDSLNSISTKGSSNNSSLASLSNSNSSSNNNIFNFKFDSKEEYIKYNGDYINESYSNLLQEELTMKIKPIYGYMSCGSKVLFR